jgi:hypothetical protein
MMYGFLRMMLGAAVVVATCDASGAHDIYSGVRGKGGMLCCGGSDCAATGRADHLPSDSGRSAEQRLSPRASMLSLGKRVRSARPVVDQRFQQHLSLLRVHPAGLDLKRNSGPG